MRTFIRCIAVSAMAFLLLFSACAPATAEEDAGLLELIWEPDEAQRAADLFTEDTVTVDDTDNSVLIRLQIRDFRTARTGKIFTGT